MSIKEVNELTNMKFNGNSIRIGLSNKELDHKMNELNSKSDHLCISFDRKELDHIDLIDQYLLSCGEEKYSSIILYEFYFTYLMYKKFASKDNSTTIDLEEIDRMYNILMKEDLSKISSLLSNSEFLIHKYYMINDLTKNIKEISIFLEEDNVILQETINSFFNRKSSYKIDLYTTNKDLLSYKDCDGENLRNCTIFKLKPVTQFLRKLSNLGKKQKKGCLS